MIYTCYEMIRDCREDRSEGWSHFITHYVPVIRKLTLHYEPKDRGAVERILLACRDPQSSLFQSLEPAPERWFVAGLRQKIVADLRTPGETEIDLETVAAAFEPLTLLEKQAAWLETMRYSAAETGRMLRVTPETVEKVRSRSADLLRGKLDTWSARLLVDSGLSLGRAAAEAGGEDCVPAKTFLDVLDGRMTWGGREQMERHVGSCWHCVDHFCRMVEIVETLRGLQPLSEPEAEPYRKLLKIESPKRSLWKRWSGGS